MDLDGFLLIDKPPKITSAEVTSLISKLVGKKCGHIGTLDPNVSGILPIAIGRSRKLIRFIEREKKEYVGVLKLSKEVPRKELETVFKNFVGEIIQMPPIMSAVAKKRRKRKVYSLKILEVHGKKILFSSCVEAGTYIRVLCEDIGKALGIRGRMDELRRIGFGQWNENQCLTLESFIESIAKQEVPSAFLTPEKALGGKKVEIKNSAIESIKNGSPLYFSAIVLSEPFNKGDILKIMCGFLFVGVAVAEADYLSKNGIAARFLRVHI